MDNSCSTVPTGVLRPALYQHVYIHTYIVEISLKNSLTTNTLGVLWSERDNRDELV